MRRGGAKWTGIAAAALALLAAPSNAADKTERPTPSGLPVPRYVSLKFDTVNARSAPGDDSRLLWVYHARGLPVQVVRRCTQARPRSGSQMRRHSAVSATT